MAELPGLIYAQDDDHVYVNLFIGSEAHLTVKGVPVRIVQKTNYPWDGTVEISVEPARPVKFTLVVRRPAWTTNPTQSALYRFADAQPAVAHVHYNGNKTLSAAQHTSELTQPFEFDFRWKHNDRVTIEFPMPVRRVLANDKVADDRGLAAIQRGPILYALEGVDNGGTLKGVTLPLETPLTASFRPELLNGVEVVTGRVAGHAVTAIPYYAWNNRGKGEMEVWVPR
jgi:hypothetical protein